MPVMDMMWGDRYGTLVDPFGHRWSVATHKIEMSPAEMQKAMDELYKKRSAAKNWGLKAPELFKLG
jgi:hypothetical protein